MYSYKKSKVDIYRAMTFFLVCGFLGWIFETIAVFIETGELTDRGYLFIGKSLASYFPFFTKIPLFGNLRVLWGLPIIEIYGLGGLIIYILLAKFKWTNIEVFLYGMVSMTLFELLGSYYCTSILHRTLWNYSNDFLNFQGRICLRSALAWGMLCLLMKKAIIPFFENLYRKKSVERKFRVVVTLLIIYTIICGAVKY